MNTPILTPLADYAKQRGLSRQRVYQLKDKLQLIELPLFVECSGLKIPLYKDRKPLMQIFVQQSREQLTVELDAIKEAIRTCDGCNLNRLHTMQKEIEFILK
jgi:hypothetical protein